MNKTDTSFTARKVVVRQQNLGSTAASASNLPALLKSCLPNCGHYNVNMRKEALNTIYKTIKDQDEAALTSADVLALLDSIFLATFRLICDDDANVRATLAVLITCVFEKYPSENLSSFFPRWLNFLSLATSHIKPDVRRDSVKFVTLTLKTQKRLLLPHIPALLTAMAPLVTAYPTGKNRSLPAFDCVVALIDAYLSPFLDRETKAAQCHSQPLIRLSWPLPSEGLLITRPSPYSIISASSSAAGTAILPPLISSAQLKPFLAHLSSLTISVFLDTSHLLCGVAVGRAVAGSADYKQLQTLLSFYRKLWRLARVCGDEELFWVALPAKMSKFRSILEPELTKKK